MGIDYVRVLVAPNFAASVAAISVCRLVGASAAVVRRSVVVATAAYFSWNHRLHVLIPVH